VRCEQARALVCIEPHHLKVGGRLRLSRAQNDRRPIAERAAIARVGQRRGNGRRFLGEARDGLRQKLRRDCRERSRPGLWGLRRREQANQAGPRQRRPKLGFFG
jgi:hypothetical protein